MATSHPTRRPPPQQQRSSTHQARGSESEPRLPHERDESNDSQQSQADAQVPGKEIGEQAYRDLRAGRADTDRGPVMDRLYRRNLRRAPKR